MTSVRFPEILRIILESPWQPYGLIAVQWTEVKSKYFLRFLLAVIVHFFFVFRFLMCSDALLCLTLCDSKDCSLPGSFVHGVFQARILEWVAISSSRGSSQPRDQTHISCVSCFGKWMLYHWATWEAWGSSYFQLK